jgi:hypothetical protein
MEPFPPLNRFSQLIEKRRIVARSCCKVLRHHTEPRTSLLRCASLRASEFETEPQTNKPVKNSDARRIQNCLRQEVHRRYCEGE